MFSYSYKHLQDLNVMIDDLENLVDHHNMNDHRYHSYKHGHTKDGDPVWIIDLQFQTIHFCDKNHKILFQIKFG